MIFAAASVFYAGFMVYYRVAVGPWAPLALVFFVLLVLFTVAMGLSIAATADSVRSDIRAHER